MLETKPNSRMTKLAISPAKLQSLQSSVREELIMENDNERGALELTELLVVNGKGLGE